MERTELQRAAKRLYDELVCATHQLQALRGAGAPSHASRIEYELDRVMEYVAGLMHEEDCDDG